MTNETISAIMEHLCNEARNSAHATLGVMELLRGEVENSSRRATLSIGCASADQLLRSIDDVRDLLSDLPVTSATPEEFDLVACTSDIIEGLNLASGRRARHMLLDESFEPLLVTHDRQALEEILMRILNTAFKLAQTNEVRVRLVRGPPQNRVRLTLSARDAGLALRLTKWLNSNPDQAILQDSMEVPFGIAVMVAGKRLRSLGATAKLMRDAAGHSDLVLDLPTQARGIDNKILAPAHRDALPDSLNVLVAEDCDESFVLTEVILQGEQVWRARDGQEALRMLQRRRFDLVLMDVHMPGMDGYAAIRSMREWETQTGNARTAMVVLSSDDLETQRRGAAQSGCSGFLRKPLRRSDLSQLLDRLKQARVPVS